MPAGAWVVYSQAILGLTEGEFNLNSNNFVLILLTSSYSPRPDLDTFYSDVSNVELATGNGYTVGGNPVPGPSATTTNGLLTFTASAVNWPNFSAIFRYGAILCKAGASLAPTDKLLCYSDLGNGVSIVGGGGNLTIEINVQGIFSIAHNP